MSDGSIGIVVDGDAVRLEQPFTAREVLRLGGILGEGLVIRTDGGRASLFAPGSPVSFDPAAVRPVFRTFRGAVHRLWVDGLRWDWGAPVISIADVRRIRDVAVDVPIRLQGSHDPACAERPRRSHSRPAAASGHAARQSGPVRG